MQRRRRISAVAWAALLTTMGWTTVGAVAQSAPPPAAPPAPAEPAPPLLAPAQAPAFRIEGRGWGHGVGMSQYGAYGRAQRGQTAEQILGFYYQGTEVQALPMPSGLRIWMAGTPGGTGVVVTAGSQPITIWSDAGPVGWAPAGVSPRITVSGEAMRVADDAYPGITRFWVDLDPNAPITVSPPGYRFNRGRLEVLLRPDGSLWLVITNLDMQSYLHGLAEVPSSWPTEVLRAQAIAGRSYAANKIARSGLDRPDCSCALVGHQGDQVYVGHEKEAGAGGDRWVAAVASTDSLVATYDGAPIQAFYSSSNGGHTEASEDGLSAALPYLRAVPDPDDAVGPDAHWVRDYSQDELTRWLSAFPDTNVGVVLQVEVVGPRTPSGRVSRVGPGDQGGVRIIGTAGVARVSGARFRSVVNQGVAAEGGGYGRSIKSTLFTINGA